MVVDDGRAFCWGSDNDGQLGDGGSGVNSNTPTQVYGTASYVSISAGKVHTCAITILATAQCWGDGNQGQLGDGNSVDRTTPHNVALPPGTSVSSISAGNLHTCAVTESLSVYCWGYDDNNGLQLPKRRLHQRLHW